MDSTQESSCQNGQESQTSCQGAHPAITPIGTEIWFPRTGNTTVSMPQREQSATGPVDAELWLCLIGSTRTSPFSQREATFDRETGSERPDKAVLESGDVPHTVEEASQQLAQYIETLEDVQDDETDSPLAGSETESEPTEENFLLLGDVMYTENEARERLAQDGIITGSGPGFEHPGLTIPMPPFTRGTADEELAELSNLDSFPAYVDPLDLFFQLGDIGYYGINAHYAISR